MNQVSDLIRKFFEDYEKGGSALDSELPAAQYGDPFMFASPQGVQAVKKEDFLKMLPKRVGFFKSVGLVSSEIQALEETRLDEHYIMVKANWAMHFEQEPAQPIVAQIAATYILFQQEDSLRIVFQLDHQDLMKRVQELGLWSVND